MTNLLPWIHALRVPLLIGLVFLVFPWAATRSEGKLHRFGAGMFEVSASVILLVAFVAPMVAAVLLGVSEVLIDHGPQRTPGLPKLANRRRLIWMLGLFYFSGALSTVIVLSPTQGGWDRWTALAAAAGLAVFLTVWLVARRVPSPEWLACKRAHPGYTDDDGRIHASIAAATAVVLLAAAVYVICGVWSYFAIATSGTATVPTLVWVLFLFLLLAAICTAITFYLDRLRVPLLLALALPVIPSVFLKFTDHTFSTTDWPGKAPTPRELLGATPAGADPNLIVVVTAQGGGIHAAAWTARVLQELNRAFPAFSKQVRFVSGVSGGSVGLMYFASAYDKDGHLPSTAPLYSRASSPSLDEVAWGFAFPDFSRSWLPLFTWIHPEVNRAWALTQAWTREMPQLRETKLSDWAQDARERHRPAVAFNATIAESGARYILGTVQWEASLFGRRENGQWPEKGLNLAVPTAVSLSAAYPYVSPASKPHGCQHPSCFHVLDGGYYDNYGVTTAIDFLTEGLPRERAQGKHVLLLQIESSPFAEPAANLKQQSWFYQAAAPPTALLNSWETAMRSRNEVDVALLEEVLRSRGATFDRLRVAYPYKLRPTSWFLTERDKAAIQRAWDERRESSHEVLQRFLNKSPLLVSPTGEGLR